MTEPTPANYDAVLTQIGELYSSSLLVGEQERNAATLAAYHEIGLLVQGLVGQGSRAAYGQQVVARLALDLTQRLGRGFSRRSLFEMLRFSREVPRASLRSRLGWSHYRELLRLPASERDAVAREAEARP